MLRGIARLTGADALGRTGRALVGSVSRIATETGGAITVAALDERAPITVAGTPCERFDEAAYRYGLSEADLVRAQRGTHSQFWLWSAIVVGLTAYGFAASFPLWGWALVALAVCYALRASVTNRQLRLRAADGLTAYLSSLDYLPRRP